MASSLPSFIFLLLFIPSNAQHYLTVHPKDTVVSIGASIQLNCSISCHSGIVVWKGLDNADNRHYTAHGYSVMTLENISISMEGTRICVGSCPGYRTTHQRSVELHVYAVPETLLLSNSKKNGVHYLNCSMKKVYPPPEISCYRGTERLGEITDIDEVQDVDELYNVMWSWVIPEMEKTSYRCEAQVRVNGHVLTREGTLKISNKEEAPSAVPASSTTQIISTLSWKCETPNVTTITNASQTMLGAHKDTKIGSHHSTTPEGYTNTVTIQTTQPTRAPTKSSSIEETTIAVPASSSSQIILSQKETSYMTTTINPQTMPGRQAGTTIGSHHHFTSREYTQAAVKDTVIAQSTQPTQTPTKTISIEETTPAVPAPSTSQMTSTIAEKGTSYVTTTIYISQNAQTLPGATEDTTIGSHHLTTPGGNSEVAIINTVTIQPTQHPQTPTKPTYEDGHYLMWTAVPATCLLGSSLLFLLIYRQLSRKGFFQPNHMEFEWNRPKNCKIPRKLPNGILL